MEKGIFDYFGLSDGKNLACFFDKEIKKIIIFYNDVIHDEEDIQYLGYRDFKDIVTGNIRNSIHIRSLGQINDDLENRRYTYAGNDPNMLIVFIKLISQSNLEEGLVELIENFGVIKSNYLDCLPKDKDEKEITE